MSKRVLGVVGLPGSGKSIVDDVAMKMGFSIVIMGDVIRDETVMRKLVPTPENVSKVMIEIRIEEGLSVVAKKCIPKIRKTSTRQVIVEGLRSPAEVNEFRRSFHSFKVLAIYASPKVRFRRIFSRKRSDDSTDWKTFVERDLREIEVGIGSVIVLADYTIINEGSLQCFKTKVRKFLRRVLSE
jgi:dephospho-CoA kinase